MKTIVVHSKSAEDARFLIRFARKMKMSARFLTEEEMEDRWLANMVDEAEKEGGEVPIEKIFTKLRKNENNRQGKI